MGSVTCEDNPTLNGHKLLLLQTTPLELEYYEQLRKKYSGLEVVSYTLKSFTDTDFSPSLYDNVTILTTFMVLPTPEQAPKLQYVQLMSAGANHIHGHPIYRDTDIAVCTANGVHPPQIAEWVIATFLSFQHHLPSYMKAMEIGEWKSSSPDDVEDAPGLRMGILGYGSIGRQCGRLARAMGMDVVAYTLREKATPESRRDDGYIVPGTGDAEGEFPSKWFHGSTKTDVNNFLSQDLDILVICLPLTSLTKNIIAAEQFEILSKKRTFLSNIARGPHVNTDDLIKALHSGQIRGAALDVTDPEPLPKDHPLWKAPNLIITPHVSAHSLHYYERVLAILECNLARMAQGKGLINKVDKILTY